MSNRTRWLGLRSARGGWICGLALLAATIGPSLASATGGVRLPEREDAPAEATVSESSGALGYAINIDVPPGPGGLVPQLSVNYSSHAGDGVAGIGWDLSTSMIECSRRFGVPDFANCDRFELDGELLVGATDEGGSVTRYHTLNESFNRIRRLANDTWEVTTKDGTRREYGTDLGSQIHQGAAIAVWYLRRTVDVFGNTIDYLYTRFETGGTPYLSAVSYAGGKRSVQFNYENRPDVQETYGGGLRRFVSKRLSEAIVYSGATPGVNYRLEFGYGDPDEYSTERSRLTSVTRYGMDCVTTTQKPSEAGCTGLPARTFTYTDLPDGTTSQYVDAPTAPIPYEILTSIFASLPDYEVGLAQPDSLGVAWGDVNGDGLEDMVRADCGPPCPSGSGTYKVFLGNGAGIDQVSNDDWANALAALRYDAPSLRLMHANWRDSDDINFFGTSPYCVVEPSTFESGVYLGSANDFVTPPQPVSVDDHPNPNITSKIREFAAPGNFRMADVDGDGRADLILSARVGGVWKKVGGADCDTVYGDSFAPNPLPEPDPSEYFMEDVQVVFLNQGPPVFNTGGTLTSGGWVRSADAGQPALEQGLPPFVALEFRDHENGGEGAGASTLGWSVQCAGSGFEGDFDHTWVSPSNYPQGENDPAYIAALEEVGGYCRSFVDFDVQFVELNGDGRLDVVVLETENPRYVPNNARVDFATGGARPSCPNDPSSIHGMGPAESYQVDVLGVNELGSPFTMPMPIYCSNPARSRAYVQQDDGTGNYSWVPAPSFDLENAPSGSPEHHAYLYMLRANRDAAYHWGYPWHPVHFQNRSGFHVGDVGIRLVDLNGDGLTDVVWKDPFLDPYVGESWETFDMSEVPSPYWSHQGGPTVANGVLLNTGSGWCASWDTGAAGCQGAAKYALPTHLSFAHRANVDGVRVPLMAGAVYVEGNGVSLVDVNGDALVDVVRADKWESETWLQSPGEGGGTAWKRAPAFDAPAWAKSPLHIDGDGVLDWIVIPWNPEGDPAAFPPAIPGTVTYGMSQSHSPNHLALIDNGQGGAFEIEYVPDAMQVDPALEASAELHAQVSQVAIPGSTDAFNRTRWPMRSVVSRISASALNFFDANSTAAAPQSVVAETTYTYARPRWDDENRTGMGFRVVRTIGPDGTATRRHYLQTHGLAGAVTDEIIIEAGQPRAFTTTDFELASGVPGSHPESYVGRPTNSLKRFEYGATIGAAVGAVEVATYEYDDVYGYNFRSRETRTRPSGGAEVVRVPPASVDTTNWVIGHPVEVSTYDDAGILLASESIDYHITSSGVETTRPARIDSVDQPRGSTTVDSSADSLSVERGYDFRGNLVSEVVDPDGTAFATTYCYDGDPGCPTGHASHSIRVKTTDALLNESRTTLHPVLASPTIEESDYIDVPGTMVKYDWFGRAEEQYVVPEGVAATYSSATLLSTTDYADTIPPVVTTTQYTDELQSDSVQEIVIGDGIGGAWKKIQRLPDGSGSGFTYSMSAQVRDPTANWEASTLPITCGTDSHCLTKNGLETPRNSTVSDGLGRPLTGVSPDGAFWVIEYSQATLGAGAPPSLANGTFDRVKVKNRRGQVRISYMDGDRLVRVDECDVLESPTSATVPACSGGFETTHFTFEGTGEHLATFDAIATSSNDWSLTGPHVLRLEYDTLGRVRAIVDPDRTAPQTTAYNARGLVESVTNARGQTRTHSYDALGRLMGVTTPANEGNVGINYPSAQLQKSAEIALSEYRNDYFYDELGRLWRSHTGVLGSMKTDYEYDLLGRQTKITHPISDAGVRAAVKYEYDGPFVKRVCDLDGAADCSAVGAGQVYVDNTAYDANGSLTALSIAGGTRTYEYDPTTRYVTKDRFESGAGGTYWVERLMKDVTTGDPFYDEVGNVLEIVGTSSLSDFDFSTRHTFDEQGRVKSWERVGDPGGARSFNYDAVGNLIENAGRAQIFDDPAHPHAIASRDSGSVAYTYDADGNIATITEAGSTRHFTFDSAGRMTCIGTVSEGCDILDVTYELSGMRVKEVAAGELRRYVGHDFQYIDGPVSSRKSIISIQVNGSRVATNTLIGGEIAEVFPGTTIWIPTNELLGFLALLSLGGAMTLVLVGQAQRERSWRRRARSAIAAAVAVQFATVPLAYAGGGSYPASSTINWVLSDAIGSALVELDSSGDRLTHSLYEPFGRLEESVGTGGVRYFAGHPFSEAAGLNYMVARWQDPEAGVFLSVDPLVPDEWDPQSYNAFAYARNNPISMYDPTGREFTFPGFEIEVEWGPITHVQVDENGNEVSSTTLGAGGGELGAFANWLSTTRLGKNSSSSNQPSQSGGTPMSGDGGGIQGDAAAVGGDIWDGVEEMVVTGQPTPEVRSFSQIMIDGFTESRSGRAFVGVFGLLYGGLGLGALKSGVSRFFVRRGAARATRTANARSNAARALRDKADGYNTTPRTSPRRGPRSAGSASERNPDGVFYDDLTR